MSIWNKVRASAARQIYRTHGHELRYQLGGDLFQTVLAVENLSEYQPLKHQRSIDSGSVFLHVLEAPPDGVESVDYLETEYSLGSCEPTGEGEWQLVLTPTLKPDQVIIQYQKRSL